MTDPTPEITPTRDEAVPERPRIEPLLKDGDVVERLKQFRMRWQESGDLTYLGKTLVDAIVEIEALRKALDIPALAERIMHRLFPQGSTADRHITTGYAWERLQKDIAKALEAELLAFAPAPAEMPGVEEIGQALAIFFANNRQPCMSGDPRDRLSPLRRRDLDDATSAILALFAPIMAGKERTALRRETRALSQAQEWRNIAEKAEARALAAEAAVLAVAPHVDSIVCYTSTIDEHDGNRIAKLVNEAAAAIRAQANNEPGA